jgi:hypothetical protein
VRTPKAQSSAKEAKREGGEARSDAENTFTPGCIAKTCRTRSQRVGCVPPSLRAFASLRVFAPVALRDGFRNVFRTVVVYDGQHDDGHIWQAPGGTPGANTGLLDAGKQSKTVFVTSWQKNLLRSQQGEWMGMSPRGKPMSIGVIDIFRMAEGRIAEHWGLTDSMAMMQQLGATPAPE